MVHNGIEYGIMAAYAEGFNILHHANIGADVRQTPKTSAARPIRRPIVTRIDARKSPSFGGAEALYHHGCSI